MGPPQADSQVAEKKANGSSRSTPARRESHHTASGPGTCSGGGSTDPWTVFQQRIQRIQWSSGPRTADPGPLQLCMKSTLRDSTDTFCRASPGDRAGRGSDRGSSSFESSSDSSATRTGPALRRMAFPNRSQPAHRSSAPAAQTAHGCNRRVRRAPRTG